MSGILIFFQSYDDLKDLNKGALINIGFRAAMQEDMAWDCVIAHDVNLVPMDLNTSYQCTDTVSTDRHANGNGMMVE